MRRFNTLVFLVLATVGMLGVGSCPSSDEIPGLQGVVKVTTDKEGVWQVQYNSSGAIRSSYETAFRVRPGLV